MGEGDLNLKMNAAVFIDGGYLATILKNYGSPKVDHEKLIDWACGEYQRFRAYYYDCLPYQSSNPTPEERTKLASKQRFFNKLNQIPRFTVRQGRLEYRGISDDGSQVFVQKRVDLQLGLDIASLVSKSKIDMAVLFTGDSDFVPAVSLAQEQGVLVRLVHGPARTYHKELWNAVDERWELTEEIINKYPL